MGTTALVGAAAGLAVVAGGAMARCPEGRADAARGVVFTVEPGLYVTDRLGPGGMVESVQRADWTDEHQEFVALYGILPVSFTMRRSAEADAFWTGHAITWEGAAMPEPVPGLEWQGTGSRVFRNAGEPDSAPGVISYGVRVTGESEVVIGDCRYATLVVETRMEESDATFITEEVMDYLPALGLGVIRRNRTVPVGETPGEWYDAPGALAIAVVEE